MTPNRDQRMIMMQALGDVSLYMHAPFDWRVRHEGVLIVEDDDDLVPEGRGTNPICAPDDHWRQLTLGSPLIHLPAQKRYVRYRPGAGFVDVTRHHRQAA